MKTFALLLILLLGSCTIPAPVTKKEAQYWRGEPMAARKISERADELNWTLLYMYSYVKAFNEYAKAEGWEHPDVPPLCRLEDFPDIPPLPSFIPTYNQSDPRAFERELAEYIKVVRRSYRDTATKISIFEKSQRNTCLF